MNYTTSSTGKLSNTPYVMFITATVAKVPFTLSSCLKSCYYKTVWLIRPSHGKQLARDLLFRRFVGLSLTDNVPDHSTIWRYHKHLGELGLTQPLFNQINEQLAEQNIIIKAGSVSIIDASIVEAKNKRAKKANIPTIPKTKKLPTSVKKDSTGKVKTTYGFKIHLNCDEDSFVKKLKPPQPMCMIHNVLPRF